MNELDYLREVMSFADDIRGMSELAQHAAADVGIWLEMIRNAADSLHHETSQRLKEAERDELYQMTHD